MIINNIDKIKIDKYITRIYRKYKRKTAYTGTLQPNLRHVLLEGVGIDSRCTHSYPIVQDGVV